MTDPVPTASGLDDVVAAETVLSDVDGQAGQLVLRGYRVEDLVGRVTFEDVCGLMWNGALPSPGEREAMRAALAVGRALAAPDAMEALRAALAGIWATGDPVRDRVSLTGAIPVVAAAWERGR